MLVEYPVQSPDGTMSGIASAVSLSNTKSRRKPSGSQRQADSSLARHCRMLEQMVEHIVDLLPVAGISQVRSRASSSRQVTLYLCHVALGVSQVKIARIFAISRTVVRHSCQTIENRRDDRHLDDVLEIIGRLARNAVLRSEACDD